MGYWGIGNGTRGRGDAEKFSPSFPHPLVTERTLGDLATRSVFDRRSASPSSPGH
ncbi:MAG: hypothetical protein KME21_14130 [Desmonostoc vinosum HA7617-LM4]|nr:hypothetical protein [Desmonostoc vinosum HA7617-LM4]